MNKLLSVVSLMVGVLMPLVNAGQPKVTIDFKPGARIECEPDSPITVNLLDFAEVKVDTPLTKALKISSTLFDLQMTGTFPKGWTGDSPIEITFLLKASDPPDMVQCHYIAAIAYHSDRQKHMTTRNPSGRAILLHTPVNESNRKRLWVHCTQSPDRKGYIPSLPLTPWMDSVFARAAANDALREAVLSFYIGEESGNYSYGSGSGGMGSFLPDVNPGGVRNPAPRFLSYDLLPVQFIAPINHLTVPISSEGVTFNLADSIMIWLAEPLTKNLYFKIEGREYIYDFSTNPYWELSVFETPAVITGMLPVGWTNGDSLPVTASLPRAPAAFQRRVAFSDLQWFSDPEMTQPLFPESVSGKTTREMFSGFDGLEVVSRPLVFIDQKMEGNNYFTDTPLYESIVATLKLSKALDSPLEVSFNVIEDEQGVFSVVGNPITIPAGVDSMPITIQKSHFNENCGIQKNWGYKLEMRIKPADIPRACISAESYHIFISSWNDCCEIQE